MRGALFDILMRRYYVSKFLWIPFVMAFAGLFVLGMLLVDYIRFSSLKTMDGKALLTIKSGQYAEVSFEEMLLNREGYPMEGVFFYAAGNYGRFLLPVDDACVQIEFSATSDVLEDLRKLKEGGKKKVTILVRAIGTEASSVDLNEFPKAEGKILANTVLREVTKQQMAEKWRFGFLLVGAFWGIAFGMLFTSIGIHRAQPEVPFEKSKRFYEILSSFNKEEELERTLGRKEELKKKQTGMRLRIVGYALMAAVCFAVFLRLLYSFEETAPIVAMLCSAAVFFWSVIQAWKSLLNSSWTPALAISKKFSVNSIPVKLEETSILIGTLKRMINEEREAEASETD